MTFGILVRAFRTLKILPVDRLGGLLSSGITYGTAQMTSTWAWRLPSAIQGFFSILCIAILPFIPESPRWLIHRDRHEEALESIALAYSDGDQEDPIVLAQYREIVDTLKFERESGKTMSMAQIVKTKGTRKRMLLNISVAVISMLSGNNIISYYLGTMLDNGKAYSYTNLLSILSEAKSREPVSRFRRRRANGPRSFAIAS